MYQEIIVDKESFDMLGFSMEMDMVIENDGEKMNIGQNTTAEYSKVDEIDKIEVPQDVIDSAIDADEIGLRSEEHTSELQSRFDLVCRLLLEKKKRLR